MLKIGENSGISQRKPDVCFLMSKFKKPWQKEKALESS